MNDDILKNQVKITGQITHVVFHSEETLYTVAKFKLNDLDEKQITVTGIMPQIEKDTVYEITGSYTEHPRYGMQFSVFGYKKLLPSESEGIVRYLSGLQFPGIGHRTAQRIVDTLGESCLDDMRSDPSCLDRVEHLSKDKIQTIIEGLKQDEDGMDDLVQFLNVQGIGMRNLIRLNRAYGKDALDKLRENPYRVIEECDGFGFKTADRLAMSLGIAKDDRRRIYAYLIALTNDICMRNGDAYVQRSVLEETFTDKMNGIEADFDDLLRQALTSFQLIQEEDRIYPAVQYNAETSIAEILRHFPEEETEEYDETVAKRYLDAMQKDIQISYDEDQTDAISAFLENPFLILTGGPGTGKTTVVRAMVTMFRMLYPNAQITCCAPTGRAAKRLADLTESSAVTIHSLLKWDLETNTFGMNKDNPVLTDLLIVDEFSMVDANLFAHLLDACRHAQKICIIGDEDQLPSVSCGCVLRDLIDADQFPLKRLTHIYRQKQGSDVITLAHQIHEGSADFSVLQQNVAFLECGRSEIRQNIISVVRNAIDKGYNLNDIQVLSPMYQGPEGIDILNNALQEAFNPYHSGDKQMQIGYTKYRINDKILQLKNQPDDDVYNGDIGILEDILTAEESETHRPMIVVRFDASYVEYGPETFQNITLAYCISIHKSQGSEYPIVIMPVTMGQRIMLQRKLLYTGITRARNSLILMGEKDAFRKGIETLDRHIRQTTLTDRLKKNEAFI